MLVLLAEALLCQGCPVAAPSSRLPSHPPVLQGDTSSGEVVGTCLGLSGWYSREVMGAWAWPKPGSALRRGEGKPESQPLSPDSRPLGLWVPKRKC